MLAIGGLDPGGGAGILADARAILKAGAFPCAAVSLYTVQSTMGVRSTSPVPHKELAAACVEVLKVERVRAIKVGALGSEANAKTISDLLAIHRDIPNVVDTVMLPTRGRSRLLDERAVSVLRDRVLRRATLVTVNAHEAEVLSGQRVTRLDEAHEAVIDLLALGPRVVMLKGGHLTGEDAVDLLAFRERPSSRSAKKPGARVVELHKKRLKLNRPIHGGGCSLASLIAGRLATFHPTKLTDRAIEESILDAVRWAKRIHHAALACATDIGGDMSVLFA